MQELTIRDMLAIFRKKLALIIIVPVLVAAIVGIYFYCYADDAYTATTSLYVLIRYEDTTGNMRVDTTTSSFFASDYKELFDRSPVIEKTCEELGIETLKDVAEMKVTSVANTRIVEVSATAKDPIFAAVVANTASRIFKSYIEEFMRVDSVSITKEAEVPIRPSGPARARNTLLAFALALLATAGCVLALEMLNTKITSDRQIEEELNQPLLGAVLDYRKDLNAYMDKERSTVNNLYRYVNQPVRESVKMVAMNIGFSSVDKPVRSIAVTSSTPSEGKSSLTVLLASAFAEEGKLVLLVDGDFRKPSVGRLFKRRNDKDMMDYLTDRVNMNDVVTATAVKNVYFIDSSHSAALLSRAVQSDSFDKFLAMAGQTFDLVIFDTPPLGMFIDAAVLASKLDGAVMVIASNQVEKNLAEGVLEQLHKSGATTLGVVMNFLPQPKSRGYYYNTKYSGYYYYGHYASTDEKKQKRKQAGGKPGKNPPAKRERTEPT